MAVFSGFKLMEIDEQQLVFQVQASTDIPTFNDVSPPSSVFDLFLTDKIPWKFTMKRRICVGTFFQALFHPANLRGFH